MSTFQLYELPEELVLLVADQCRDRDLARFSRTSQESRRIGQLALYDRLSHEGIKRVFKWAKQKNQLEPIFHVLDRHRQQVELQKNPKLAADALSLACEEGHVDLMKALLDAGIPPNTKCNQYWPLEVAATHGHPAIMQVLYDAGAKLTSHFARNYMLLCTGKPGRLATGQMLLSHGFDLHQQRGGEGFLHHACRGTPGAAATLHNLELLLQLGLDVNVRNTNDETPLVPAVRSGLPGIVEFLLSHGADVHVRSVLNQPPLAMAINRRHASCDPHEMAKCLLDAGAGFNEQWGVWLVLEALTNQWTRSLALVLESWNTQVSTGWDCSEPELLFYAAATVGNVPMLRGLLQVGEVDPNCNFDGTTALMAAAEHNNVAAIELLVQHVSCFDYEDSGGRTAFRIALQHQSEEAIRVLLPHITWTSPKAPLLSPLIDAVNNLSPDLVAMILDKLSSSQPQSHLQEPTPAQQEATAALEVAIQLGKLDTVQVLLLRTDLIKPSFCPAILCTALGGGKNDDIALKLLDWGAEYKDPQPGSYTPLMRASLHGNVRALSALLGKGAPLDARTGTHETALTLAVSHNQPECVRRLLAAGARASELMHFANYDDMVEDRDRPGSGSCQRDTVFLYAARHGYAEIVDILRPYFDVTKP
ncbi:ankyrin repeat domain-containing protein [Aspergillus mulundensis]|uniref:Uncharacterized protein n=1 Tax=Aspergillus mulundensis TaxID=1810919 RepID=A0A3D8S6H6_9EURO|nr:hypothetical protein DSM5745_05171 [Aspergillus mulundensis]RDW81614.1 hypothetical protein DSM5745_05171 [Aspergillus mulundensis]